MTVIYLRGSARRGYVTVGVRLSDAEKKYTVPEGAVSLCRGYELSEEEHLELVRLDEERRALDRAASLLAASDKSRAILRARLISLGFSREVADMTVAECVRLGYLNEERQLERLILREAEGSLRGPKYIMRKLAAKGYRTEEIRRTISALTERGDIDFKALFARLAEKRGITDREELLALAYKYGYK